MKSLTTRLSREQKNTPEKSVSFWPRFQRWGVWFALMGLFAASTTSGQVRSPDGIWAEKPQMSVARSAQSRVLAEPWVQPKSFRAVSLDAAALEAVLQRAPKEFSDATEITLPMPDGTFQRFKFVESPVMPPGLAAKFPKIRTYYGRSIEEPSASARFEWVPSGFHGQVLSSHGAVYVDPQWRGNAVDHLTYYKHDCPPGTEFQCEAFTAEAQPLARAALAAAPPGGLVTLRTFRLAVAATGEYTQLAGGTVQDALAAIVITVNRVNGIYVPELAIRFVLVEGNEQLIYTNPNTDPYHSSDLLIMANQNQTNLDNIIGDANYDVGHVFSSGFGGLGLIPAACLTGTKAKGVTSLRHAIGDPYDIADVAHELGHQLGANHTFNGTGDSCLDNREAGTAFEPGSGSTLMAYASLCSPDDLQAYVDPYFHSDSLDAINFYLAIPTGGACASSSQVANFAPVVSAGSTVTIPKQTPFTLTANGIDPDGSPLTFCWEERDLGPAQALAEPDNGSSPLFRSFLPTPSPSRTFPRLTALLSQTPSLGERLPTLGRTMKFRVTARDNHPEGGGYAAADLVVNVDDVSGPFVVTSPNTAVTWSGVQTVTWNVAGTAAAPVNTMQVDVLLSTNGGLDFPIALLSSTPNDGSATVALPSLSTTQARIKVQGHGNVFFDVSDHNFSITPSMLQPLIELGSATLVAENCQPGNGAVDPGETVTVQFDLRNIGTADTADLTATLAALDGVSFPSEPRSYGALMAGGAAVARTFTFTASGSCAGSVTARLALRDGATDLGTVSRTFSLGTAGTVSASFTNTQTLTIPVGGKASPYPSTLSVSGFPTALSKVTLTLSGFTHGGPDDVDAVLVAPTGQRVLFMSDVGGITPVSDLTLTFDDAAARDVPDFEPAITSGSFRPTNIGTPDNLPGPAPGPPYGSLFSTFNGLNPNGVWSLYVYDDVNTLDAGSIARGWSLRVTAPSAVTCCTGSANADLAVSIGGPAGPIGAESNLTYALTVMNAGPGIASPVTLTNQLSEGVVITAIHTTQGSCTNNSGVIVCQLGPMTNAASAVVSVTVLATHAGEITNKVSVRSSINDPSAANNVATATWTVLPVVSLVATDPSAAEAGLDSAEFVLMRTGGANGALAVNYAVSGSASNGVDYAAINGAVPFPAGAPSATLVIVPMDDAVAEGDETVTVTLLPAAAYLIDASHASALVSIADNDTPAPMIVSARLSETSAVISFTTVSGHLYRLERTADLATAQWETAAEVPGTGGVVEVSDPNGMNLATRFYRIRMLP